MSRRQVFLLALFLFVAWNVDQIRLLIGDVFRQEFFIACITGLLVLWGCLLIVHFLVRSPEFTWVDRVIANIPDRQRNSIGTPLRWIVAASTQGLFGLATLGPIEVLDGQEKGDGTTERHVRVWRRTGEVLTVLIILTFVLEGLWIGVECIAGLSMTVYTVWAFSAIAFAGILIAALVDYLHRNTSVPWRLIAIILVLAVASIPSHVDLGTSDIPDTAGTLRSVAANKWVDASLDRLENET
jgi:hypothetical protein